MDTPPDAIAREVLEYLLLRLKDADRRAMYASSPEFYSAMGATFAFERIGILEDADAWQERFREAHRKVNEEQDAPPMQDVVPPPVAPANLDEALSFVESLIDGERRVAEMQGRTLPHPPSLTVAQAVLKVLDDMHLIREEDWERWSARFERAARSDLAPTARHSAEALEAARIRVEEAAPLEQPAEAPLVHPIPTCTQEHLRDVLVLDAPSAASAKPMTIERYDDGVVLTWTGPYDRPGPRAAPRFPRAQLGDDVGTQYFPGGGGGGGGGADVKRTRYTFAFAPAIPPDASELRLTIDDEGFALALPIGK